MSLRKPIEPKTRPSPAWPITPSRPKPARTESSAPPIQPPEVSAGANPPSIARSGSAAWIQGGLAAGTVVIVYPPSAVRDGVRVKARKV